MTPDIPRLTERSRWRPLPGTTRREFIRLTSGVALALGVATLNVFDRARAYATHSTPSTLDSSVCYKPANASGTKCCSCGSSVSSGYCNSEGWHKHHDSTSGCAILRYQLRTTSCNGRNAWDWLVSEWGGSSSWRCSDGKAKYENPCSGYYGGWYNSVCPKQV